MITASGMMSGISISMLKLTTELMQSKAFVDSIGLVIIIMIGAFMAAACQIHMLNGAMKFFDQLEVMPIY